MNARRLRNDRQSAPRAGLEVAAVCMTVALLSQLSGCGGYREIIRYRVTFEVEMDGEVKSGSSIIEVLYYGSNSPGSTGASGASGYSRAQGVAPVVDLGRHGMLVAAMSPNYAEYYRRQKKHGLACKIPTASASWPAALGLTLADLKKRTVDKSALKDDLFPAFIWFPDGAPYQEAQQICPEEFSRVIGANVELRSVMIEFAPKAPLLTRLDIKAPWLDEIRIDQRT